MAAFSAKPPSTATAVSRVRHDRPRQLGQAALADGHEKRTAGTPDLHRHRPDASIRKTRGNQEELAVFAVAWWFHERTPYAGGLTSLS